MSNGCRTCAAQAAVNYTCKCAMMQKTWIKWNSMTERWEFLYVKVSNNELFSRSWKSMQESIIGNQEPWHVSVSAGSLHFNCPSNSQ